MKKQVIFISGLGGTGKSTLVWHFMEHPIPGYSFYDFDKGKYKIPPYDEGHLEWRTDMTKWWLEIASKEQEVKGNIVVIVGFSLYPQSIRELSEARVFGNNIHFGLLLCNSDKRKERLESRGDAHHYGGHKEWYDEFFANMKEVEAKEFDTTHTNVEKTAQDVQNWIESLEVE